MSSWTAVGYFRTIAYAIARETQNLPSSIVRSLLISPSIIRASNAAASAYQQLSGTSGD